ncbi:MAG: hypothetical protein GY943_10530 [Chloroflexi bacterium]|nr:hypothetical protein [Chloroflexota bacterium]
MDFVIELAVQMSVTLVSIMVGTLAALALDRRNERRHQQKRANVVLRSLAQELSENQKTLQSVRPAFQKTAWGRSFYLSTTAWETAVSQSDLPDVIGYKLTDAISDQYAQMVKAQYYVDLLTNLWMSSDQIPGYTDIRKGFHRAILKSMTQAINQHKQVMNKIEYAQRVAIA